MEPLPAKPPLLGFLPKIADHGQIAGEISRPLQRCTAVQEIDQEKANFLSFVININDLTIDLIVFSSWFTLCTHVSYFHQVHTERANRRKKIIGVRPKSEETGRQPSRRRLYS